MKNVLSKKAIAGAMALAIAIPGISYASSTTDTEGETVAKQEMVESKETEIRSLLQSYKNGELTEDEVMEKLREERGSFSRHGGHPFKEIDEETKQQLDEIKEQVEAGELTKEEARDQMEELGLPPHPGKGFKNKRMDDLTDEQKAALEDIHEQVENGELSREEAKDQMEELGLDFFKGPRHEGAEDSSDDVESEDTAV